jgi:predicted PurR-regulated permease PerM
MEDKHKAVALFILLLIFAYLSYRILEPFLNFIVFGILFAFLFYPVYKWLTERMNSTGSALLVLLCVLLVIIIPSIWLTASLITQAGNAYEAAQAQGIQFNGTGIASRLQMWIGLDLHEPIISAFSSAKEWLTRAIPGIISSTGAFLLGLFILFFVMYYALKEGATWYQNAGGIMPIRKKYKERLIHDVELMTKALFYGQVLTAVLIGVLCGIIFVLFGIPNAIFWGFVMIIFSFLPILGAPVVYIPAGIILMFNGGWIGGILLILLCAIAQFVVDYYVRPKIIGKQAEIHPLIVIIGALGGVIVFGFVGFLVGPLILGLFLRLLTFDYGL